MSALDHGGDWHLRNACPACMYKLEGEPDLVFEMLVTMDGNDSLKHILRQETMFDKEGNEVHANVEVSDDRKVFGDYYLKREHVDRWAKDRIEEALTSRTASNDDAENPCAEHWTNMVNEMTAQMWTVFDETGIFLALCCHGFVLIIADMVCRYKLHKHIAKALQTRSQAITTALKQYNTTAAAMIPPRPTLTWNRVVQYAFLSEFDLLRDSRKDVREHPWAKPASWALMDCYFKICHAHEEIERLNIEICHIITHMQDEDKFLHSKAHDISLTDPHLSHQVLKYHSLHA
ncbi:hypothetical protein AN958_05922 [Leucoagaricus sp. SymC.cos]|nr:hypothetical protein AN958_05922 [Leucoagaricus sp. SymC.cos]